MRASVRRAPRRSPLTLTLSRGYTGEGTRGAFKPIAVLLLALFFFASPASAQTRPATGLETQAVQRARPASAATTPADGSINWQRLLLAMVVVLGLIFALRYAAGWLFPSARAGVGGRGVRVLARTPIAPRQQVLLLHVGRRVLVVGDSAGTLSSLAAIDEPDEVAELLGQVGAPAASPVASRFKAMFGRAETEYEEQPDARTMAEIDRADADHNIIERSADPAEHDAPADANVTVPDPAVAAVHEDISGLLARMRSLSKTVRH